MDCSGWASCERQASLKRSTRPFDQPRIVAQTHAVQLSRTGHACIDAGSCGQINGSSLSAS